MTGLLRLCRWYYSLPMALTFALTVVYASAGEVEGVSLLFATVGLSLVIAAGYTLNDVLDFRVDAYNAPRRPIPAGLVSRRLALAWSAALFWGGLLMAAGSQRWGYLAVLAMVALGLVAYNATSKRLGIGKQLFVATLMTSLYPMALAFAGGARGPRAWSLLPFAGWMFLSSWGYEIIKDIRDRKGDAAVAQRRSAVHRHPRTWMDVASWLTLLGGLLLPLAGVFGMGWIYILGSFVVLLPLAIFAARARILWRKIHLIYAEFVCVGLLATLDVIVYGFST